MSLFQRLLALGLMALLIAGCAETNPEYEDPDPEATYAASVKNQFISTLSMARNGSPDEVADETAMLMEMFGENYDPEAAGKYEETVEQLRVGAKQLENLASGSASSSDVQSKIDELLAIAETLPGDVDPYSDQMEGDADDYDDY